jgi:F-type H+-transporting ATPase subunit b
MPQLDPTWFASQLFWLLMSFGLLYVLLARWALPRIQGVLSYRAETLASDADRARRMTEEADRARQDYESALSDARTRAQYVFNEAVLAQKSRTESAAKAMDIKVAGMLAEATKKIETQKKNLLDALVPASTEIANMIVEKLTRQESRDSAKVIVTELFKGRSR